MLHLRRLLLPAAAALIVAACSSDQNAAAPGAAVIASAPTTEISISTSTSTASSTSTATSTTTTTAASPSCVPPSTTTPINATPADDTGRDWDITSFDGTVIRAHWFPLPGLADDQVAPTILMGPGWGSAGDTNEGNVGVLGALSIKMLRDNGYNVLTWDPRGFGASTGSAEVDSVDYEARDVQQLIDWIATQPQAQLDAVGDPVSGMIGGSYGGGIQLVTAAIDCRVDALVPVVAWNSLQTSLFKADTPKIGWGNLLAAAASGASLDPTITRVNEAGNATGVIDPADVQWFADRGPGDLVAEIEVPTLIVQGTVDTLFTLDEGVSNYELLQQAGVPTAMLWFCGGHGVCLTQPGDQSRLGQRAIAWLDRYVKRDESIDTGSEFEFIDQDGVTYTANEFDSSPNPSGAITASGSGTLQLVADGGAGPAAPPAGSDSPLAGFFAGIMPAKAANAVNVTIPGTADALVLGAPELTLTYAGTVAEGERPTRVFAQLVDDVTGLVLGNQITPIEVVLDGQQHTATVPLEMVAHHVRADTSITLQLVATTVAYAPPRLGGAIDFSAIDVTLPVTTAAAAG